MIDITINQSQKRSRNVTVSFWKSVFGGELNYLKYQAALAHPSLRL